MLQRQVLVDASGRQVSLSRQYGTIGALDIFTGNIMLSFIDRTELRFFVLASLLLGLAPFVPEPHVLEKLKMLADGTLSRPLDIFDLFLHGTPWVLLLIKLLRLKKQQA